MSRNDFSSGIILFGLTCVGVFFAFAVPRVSATDEEEHNTKLDEAIESYYMEIKDQGIEIDLNDIARRTKKVCDHYVDICNKIVINDDIDIQKQYELTMITVYLVTQIDIHLHPRFERLEDVLGTVQIVDNDYDPKGNGGHTHIRINLQNILNNQELIEIITHELGHVLDLGAINDNHTHQKNVYFKRFGSPAFGVNDRSLKFYTISWRSDTTQRSYTLQDDIVSIYGNVDPFEDFAEYFNTWVHHHAPLIQYAKSDKKIRKKYFLFREIFGKRYIDADVEGLQDLDPTQRPPTSFHQS